MHGAEPGLRLDRRAHRFADELRRVAGQPDDLELSVVGVDGERAVSGSASTCRTAAGAPAQTSAGSAGGGANGTARAGSSAARSRSSLTQVSL